MSYVKFMLSQLNRENGGFTFEQLARDLIHAEYCRNIVPATGPVGPGDKGEDARTHKNYILDSDDALYLYEGLAPRTDERIIFAFSIREDWETKLDADVNKILENDLRPEKIVFATSQFISTRERQSKETSLRESKGCDLEILDGSWFTQHLDSDHYGLAVKYLGCEQKLDTRLEEMYRRVLGFEHETLDDEDRQEVECLKELVKYRTSYARLEHLILDLKHLADVFARYSEHLDDAFKWYEEALREANRDHIEPRIILDVYYAYFRALFKLPSRQKEIFDHLPTYRDLVFSANYRSYFSKLNVWQLYLSIPLHDDPKFHDFARETYEYFVQYDSADLSLLSQALLLEAEIDAQLALSICEEEFDRDLYFDKFDRLVSVVESAHFYDVGILAEKVAVMSPILFRDERYESLYDRVETLAAEILSDFERGSVRRARGMAHYNSNDPLRALQQFGKAKYLWRDYDSLRGKLLAALMISQCYRDLEQHYAAEWELLQGIYLGTLIEDNLQLDLVCESFKSLHSVALATGRLLTSIAFATLYLKANSTWGREPEPQGEFLDLFDQNMVVILSRLFTVNRPLHDRARQMLDIYQLPGLSVYWDLVDKSKEELEAEYADTPQLDTVIEMYDLIRNRAPAPLDVPIIDELQAHQLARFRSYGIAFEVLFQNNHKVRVIAESIIACLQHLFANTSEYLGSFDWLEDHVRLHIVYSEPAEHSSESCYALAQEPNAELLEMRMVVSHSTYRTCTEPPFDSYVPMMLGIWVQILDLCTLNPPSEITDSLDMIESNGLIAQFTDCPPCGFLSEQFLGMDFPFGSEEDE
jgi:hypothetical protein